jgi:dihydrofolate reductase
LVSKTATSSTLGVVLVSHEIEPIAKSAKSKQTEKNLILLKPSFLYLSFFREQMTWNKCLAASPNSLCKCENRLNERFLEKRDEADLPQQLLLYRLFSVACFL